MRTGITDVQQTFKVKALHKHSGFSMQNLKHDIAVLQLEGRAQLSDKVTTVCLPEQDADLNSKCYITGLASPLINPISTAESKSEQSCKRRSGY